MTSSLRHHRRRPGATQRASVDPTNNADLQVEHQAELEVKAKLVRLRVAFPGHSTILIVSIVLALMLAIGPTMLLIHVYFPLWVRIVVLVSQVALLGAGFWKTLKTHEE